MGTVNSVQSAGLEAASGPLRRPAPQGSGSAFSSVLEKELRASPSVRFSAHALQRLDDRGIRLTAADAARVDRAVDEAAAKGGRESLLLMDRLALVVNVPNRTVITVMPQDGTGDAVFTNIDSAVVVSRDGLRGGQNNNSIGLDPWRGGPDAAD
ncbi:MAG: hypothetical protein GY851_36625 [bacterium]|nr:hypothetical protein [bacterium]